VQYSISTLFAELVMMVAVVDVSSIDEDDNNNEDEDGVRRCKGCRLHKITEEKAELDL
jgi:hypothetical protein